MQKTQIALAAFVLLLVVLVIYSYVSGADLDSWLKGTAVICVSLFVIRLIVKYKGNHENKDSK